MGLWLNPAQKGWSINEMMTCETSLPFLLADSREMGGSACLHCMEDLPPRAAQGGCASQSRWLWKGQGSAWKRCSVTDWTLDFNRHRWLWEWLRELFSIFFSFSFCSTEDAAEAQQPPRRSDSWASWLWCSWRFRAALPQTSHSEWVRGDFTVWRKLRNNPLSPSYHPCLFGLSLQLFTSIRMGCLIALMQCFSTTVLLVWHECTMRWCQVSWGKFTNFTELV